MTRVLIGFLSLTLFLPHAASLAAGFRLPNIVVGKQVTKFFRDADNHRLARVFLLNGFVRHRALTFGAVVVPFVVTSYDHPRPLYYLPMMPTHEQTRVDGSSASIPDVEVTVSLESVDPRWNIALEVQNPNPFPVPLNFSGERRVEIAVRRSHGARETIWQWSSQNSAEGRRTTSWLEPGEAKKFFGVLDPATVNVPQDMPLIIRGVLYSYPSPLSAESKIEYIRSARSR